MHVGKQSEIMTQPTFINLHPNEYGQEFHYYPFAVQLDRCVGSCNTLNDLSNKVCVPNKTDDLNLSVFNMITGIDKNLIHINGGVAINVDLGVKNIIYVKKIIFAILLHVVVEMKNI